MSTNKHNNNSLEEMFMDKLKRIIGSQSAMFANKIGVTDKTIRDGWIKKGSTPGTKYIIRMCNIFNISANWLLLDIGPREIFDDDSGGEFMNDDLTRRVIEEQLNTINDLRRENEELRSRLNPTLGKSKAEGG